LLVDRVIRVGWQND